MALANIEEQQLTGKNLVCRMDELQSKFNRMRQQLDDLIFNKRNTQRSTNADEFEQNEAEEDELKSGTSMYSLTSYTSQSTTGNHKMVNTAAMKIHLETKFKKVKTLLVKSRDKEKDIEDKSLQFLNI